MDRSHKKSPEEWNWNKTIYILFGPLIAYRFNPPSRSVLPYPSANVRMRSVGAKTDRVPESSNLLLVASSSVLAPSSKAGAPFVASFAPFVAMPLLLVAICY